VRPSGTEPKLKCYLEVVVPVDGRDGLPAARARATELLGALKQDLSRAAGICTDGPGAPSPPAGDARRERPRPERLPYRPRCRAAPDGRHTRGTVVSPWPAAPPAAPRRPPQGRGSRRPTARRSRPGRWPRPGGVRAARAGRP